MKITPLPRERDLFNIFGSTLSGGEVPVWSNASNTWLPGTAGVTDHGALTGLADDDHSAYALAYGGGEEILSAHGNMGATETFAPASGNWHTGTFNAACTFSFTGPTNATGCSLLLELTQDGTGGWAVTLPASFANKAELEAAQVTTASTTSFLVAWTRDGGTTWYGQWVGGGLSAADFATPAIVLGTAAAAGAAATVIRSDATIAAFDATVPASVGAANATGSAAVAARRDHVHEGPSGATDHEHIGNLAFSGDGSTAAFELPAAPFDAYSVVAYVAGVRVPITLSGGILTTMTFDTAPATGTDNITVDLAAAAA